MRKRNGFIAVLTAGTVLGGCTSDPAFWNAVAEGLDQAAYDLAAQPVCSWYTDRFGVLQQSCVPAYAANAPTYYDPAPRYRDRDHRHRRSDDGRYNGDRDDRDRRHGRRDPKGGD
ncbi:hypothetical protein [Brevundimonas sp.]|uniref:hypothetical protein n=1 Tax=Brevundimonas sp. TaxID=1871086 RepID=UPI002C1C6210|nr:hypothetical protein [Brevundimonas sp.]HWQ86188.1 hypothetical protein [Brevundimonas sp.]